MNYNRRQFLRQSALAGAGLNAGLSMDAKPVRIGFIGLGKRGFLHLDLCVGLGGVEIAALCDTDSSNLDRAKRRVQEAGKAAPAVYSDHLRLLQQKDVDLAVIATPSNLHAQICAAAMKAGKHAATETPAALNPEECWQLVETSQKTGKRCVMLEQENYSRENLLILNMAQKGYFGELLCATGVHIGPIAWWIGINRGDRLESLVSVGYNSLLRTADAKTVTLYSGLSAPHPPNSELRLHGTKCLFSANTGRVSQGDRWTPIERQYQEYEHPLWKNADHKTPLAPMWQRLLAALRSDREPDFNVYDAATWSVISPLARSSASAKSKLVEIPDFTRGRWKTSPPVRLA